MKDPQLQRLTRHEKKYCVRGWNASVGAFTDPIPARHQSVDTSMSMASVISPPPSTQQSVTASDPAASRPIDPANSVETLEQQSEGVPLTVWHVRHAYRARARRVEHTSALKAADAVRGSRESLAVYRRSLEVKQPVKAVAGSNTATTALNQDPAIVCEAEERPRDDAGLSKLSATRVSMDAGYRDELLGAIRRELAAGRGVTLRADGRDSASDERLALQLLCSLSLLHCAHDQDVTPSGDGALGLRPRVQAGGVTR